MHNPLRLALLILMLHATGCTQSDGHCDADELSSALFTAVRGDTIKVGACRVRGAFVVPEGVTLEGRGAETSYLESDGTAPVVTVEPSSSANVSSVRSVGIDSNGAAALLISGQGQVELDSVRVRANYGIGIGVEFADLLRMTNTEILGPVTSSNVESVPPRPTPADIATHGLVMIDVDDAELTNIEVAGFASMGAVIVEGISTWHQGGSSDNRGAGLVVHGGSAQLSDLVLCGGIRGLNMVPVYGAVFLEGAEVQTDGLTVCRNEGIGMLHDACTVVHTSLAVHENAEAAVWGRSPESSIEIQDFDIEGNGLGGFVLHDPGSLLLRNGSISNTVSLPDFVSEEQTIEVGDGVQLVQAVGSAMFQNLTLSDNGRVGMLFELEGDEPANLSLEGVQIEGAGEQLGAIVQGDEAAIPAAWDAAISRSAELEANDQAHRELGVPLPVVENLAAGDIPLVDELEREGLDSLLGAFD